MNKLLRLIVTESRVFYELYECDLEGYHCGPEPKRSPHFGLPLASDAKELRWEARTIDLLTDLQQLVADMRRSAKWDSRIIDGIACRVVEELGEHLYRFLFQPELAQILNDALDATRGGMLRIELEFQEEALELYGQWPWEYLRSPTEQDAKRSGRYLALHAQLVLNRHLYLKDEMADFKTGFPKVLLVVAGPPMHDVGEFGIVQAEKVVTTLKALHKQGHIKLIPLVEPEYDRSSEWKPTASWEAFKTAVKDEKPDVIHFIGHGRRVYDPDEKREHSDLIFLGPQCTPDPRRDEEFVGAVETNSNLKLVFLQACDTGVISVPGPRGSATSIGQLLARNAIPAVVAMQAKIENVVANDFAEAFYMALSERKPIDCAVRDGREAIRNVSEHLKLAFGVPVLYLRSYKAFFGVSGGLPPKVTPPPPPKLAAPRSPVICPRCRTVRGDEVECDINFCRKCGLQVVCVNELNGAPCNTPISDPLGDTTCGRCGCIITLRPDRLASCHTPEIAAPLTKSDDMLEVHTS